ncbi:MAG: hypothetical protein V4555_17795 [Acidobacteriota bacterium]
MSVNSHKYEGLPIHGIARSTDKQMLPTDGGPQPIEGEVFVSNAFVLCRVAGIPPSFTSSYPFKNDDTVLVMGHIEHMPGHVALALKDGRVLFGYDASWFVPLTEDEA